VIRRRDADHGNERLIADGLSRLSGIGHVIREKHVRHERPDDVSEFMQQRV